MVWTALPYVLMNPFQDLRSLPLQAAGAPEGGGVDVRAALAADHGGVRACHAAPGVPRHSQHGESEGVCGSKVDLTFFQILNTQFCTRNLIPDDFFS